LIDTNCDHRSAVVSTQLGLGAADGRRRERHER
jgi:hypothetical protein